MLSPLVTGYVDAALSQLRRQGLMLMPGSPPAEMLDASIPPSDDWIGWKPIPSTVTSDDLDQLQQQTGLAFPPIYRDFLQYLHFLDLTEAGVRFVCHDSESWIKRLTDVYSRTWCPDRILGVGLLPFGDESFMDSGPVCFDTRHRQEDGDCPIVFWDHDRIGTAEEIRPMFSSSAKMFECLTFVAETDFHFIFHGDGDKASLLPEKQRMLAEFLALDPTGAGGPARDYWTCWGVTPSAS